MVYFCVFIGNTPVDILINNAATGGQPFIVTEDGFELTMAVNYFGELLGECTSAHFWMSNG